jgi:fumarylacetoacetase
MTNPNDPSLRSWVLVAPDSDFPIQNLPYGIFQIRGERPRVGVRIGDFVLDLSRCAQAAYFQDIVFDRSVFEQPVLNDFIACGKAVTQAVRQRISELLRTDSPYDLAELNQILIRSGSSPALIPVSEVEMKMPVRVGDYTDFYSSIEHATNVGKMFRDPANALLPNWRHLPVGYHGRASSIRVSGTPVRRPMGQTKTDEAELPTFHPCRQLDFELETAFIIGKNSELGSRIPAQDAEDYIFGFVLFNDWSARDIQRWEYVPLGPFLSKNFISSVSPWVVTNEALQPFRCANPPQEPAVLPYLQVSGDRNYDIHLEVAIKPLNASETVVCRTNFKYMYWNVCQQLAHHTVNGCNLEVGDLMGSGTISGSAPDSYGSMLELAWKGTKPLRMSDGTERKFLLDGDTVIIRGFCEKDGLRIGFGEVSGQILPALEG